MATSDRIITHKTEERLNAMSHGIGALLGCLGMYFLLNANTSKSDYATEAIIVYSLSLILLFTASTAYHLIDYPKWKHRLRILDHISIYLLIAGTYTPVALITLVEGNGWMIFSVVWAIALCGTLLKLFYTGRYEFVSLFFYLFMGWLIVFDIKDLIRLTSSEGLVLMATGGAFYTLGVLFYSLRYLPYNHLIWHFFVLAGALSHWIFIYIDVI